jgi:hypothetical protein
MKTIATVSLIQTPASLHIQHLASPKKNEKKIDNLPSKIRPDLGKKKTEGSCADDDNDTYDETICERSPVAREPLLIQENT